MKMKFGIWGRDDYDFLYGSLYANEEKHLCLLKDKRIKSKRDEFLDRLVELNLAVKDIHTYVFVTKYPKERGRVYVIASELMSFLDDYILKNFKGEIFDSSLEKYHMLFHIFSFSAKFAPSDLFRWGLTETLLKRLESEGLYQFFEEHRQSLLQLGVIALSNEGKYYIVDKWKFYNEILERFLNPLVEHLLEDKPSEVVPEPPKPAFPKPEIISPDLYFQNNTWRIFYNFLSTAESSIDICADTITGDAIFNILYQLQGKDVLKNTKIMARSIQGVGKILDLGISNRKITQCKRLHGKFIIKDKKALLVTSCNITFGALGDVGKRPGSLEASIIIEDKDIVERAQILFEGIWYEKNDIPKLKTDSAFISSAYGIPSKIEKLIKEAKKQIVIIVPPLFEKISEERKSIPEYIREELNPNISLTIYTNASIPESSWDCYQKIKDMNINLYLVPEPLHAKVYLFDDEIAFISSLNLSYTSWVESVETGYLTKDPEHIKKIKEILSGFKTIESPTFKRTDDGNGDRISTIENIRRIEVKFKTEGKRIELHKRLKSKSKSLSYSNEKRRGVPKSPKEKKQPEILILGYTRGYIHLLIPQKSEVPVPLIKTQKGWFKKCKGFSYQEFKKMLAKAGLKTKHSISSGHRVSIPIDRRRKTSYEINIKALTSSFSPLTRT